ncbi:MAG TPA: type II secretion system F family protein [Gemmatimonadales bacterium]|nr:type II secretion system F family protein [Gemmatimonadales bacterium]
MTAFTFQAVDQTGRRVRGVEEAPSPAAITRTLEQRGLVVVEVKEGAERSTLGGFRFGRHQAVLEVTRAVAALLQAGLPLARALSAASHVASPDVKPVVESVRERVARGESLANALAQHSTVFSPLFIGLVRAGERSGDLAGAFARLAEQLDREERLRSRLLSLSLYPLILATAGTAALIILAFFVLPRFAELLQSTGSTLPRSTAMVLATATFLRSTWPAFLAIGLVTPIGLAWSLRIDDGRRTLGKLLLRLPVIGSLRQQALSARVARLLGVLLSGGAPLLGALDDSRACLGDPLAQDHLERIRDQVREGTPLNKAIASSGLFHSLLAQLVAVGEESGRLREFCLKAAEIFEERTERAAQRLVTLLEPAMIVTFGVVVAFVALSVLQAIYGVNAGVLR